MKISEIIDLLAVSTAPVGAWTAICQSLGKPWAHSGFIALGAVTTGLWIVKTGIKVIRTKRKERFGGNRKRSSGKCKKNTSKKSISQNRGKNNSMIEKYFRENTPWLREGKGYAYHYEKRDIVIPPNFRGGVKSNGRP